MTAQQPIGSGFTAFSTTADVIAGIDLTGRTAVVTGGYAGLGLETARVLAAAGADVLVPVRDRAKAERNLAGIAGVRLAAMDLMEPQSIAHFAADFLAEGKPLDILVNSAGIMALRELSRDGRGYEQQFSTNHLGHFQLTTALLPALRRAGAAGGARVVSVSSWGHRFSAVVFDDIHFERRPYDRWSAYGQSKTANALFAVALDGREQANGIRAFAVHPGGIRTDLARHLDPETVAIFDIRDADGNPITDPSRDIKTVPQGAATQVWAATSPALAGLGGVYCENVEVAGIVPPEEMTGWEDLSTLGRYRGVMPHAIDADDAARLWRASEAALD